MHYGIPPPIFGSFAEDHLQRIQFSVVLPRLANDLSLAAVSPPTFQLSTCIRGGGSFAKMAAARFPRLIH